nr:hypothetical protein [Tanacetum cinerariifolium]
YAGTLPVCNKCKFYHNGLCTTKCANCKKVGHLTRDCWNPTYTSNQKTITCYECANQGHYKSDCPELKNRNHGNQAEGVLQMPILLTPKKALEQVRRLHAMNVGTKGTTGEIVRSERTKTTKNQIKSTKARGVVHAFGGGEIEQDLNNIEDEIEA